MLVVDLGQVWVKADCVHFDLFEQMEDMTENGFKVKWTIGTGKQVCTEKDTFMCQKHLAVQMSTE